MSLLIGAYPQLQVIGAAGFGVVAVLALRFLLWYLFTATSNKVAGVGLDAAEKGDTRRRRPLTAKVPYDLEKRAIMHKRWMMVAHDSQFRKPGDYRTYTIVDIPFLIIRGEDGKLRAFHNVCRHRAYTVARKSGGNTLRLACKYHGWQYGSTGCLVKAPQFMDKADFDPASNGLFQIHLKIDSGRFVFVNFASSLSDAFPWSDISSPTLQGLDFHNSTAWEMEIDIPWRIASLLPWFVNTISFLTTSWRSQLMAYLDSSRQPRLQYVDDASFICNLNGQGVLLISALPLDGAKSLIKCNYKAEPGATDSSSLQRLVETEIKATADILKQHQTTTTNLDFRQSAVRERLDKFARHIDHHKRMEKVAGKRINPVVRTTGHAPVDVEAEAICTALEAMEELNESDSECLMEQSSELEW